MAIKLLQANSDTIVNKQPLVRDKNREINLLYANSNMSYTCKQPAANKRQEPCN